MTAAVPSVDPDFESVATSAGSIQANSPFA